jgi:hypothetical protein
MSSKTVYITPQIWGKLKKRYGFADTAVEIESLVSVTNRYASNVENDLRIRNEHSLADKLLAALTEL